MICMHTFIWILHMKIMFKVSYVKIIEVIFKFHRLGQLSCSSSAWQCRHISVWPYKHCTSTWLSNLCLASRDMSMKLTFFMATLLSQSMKFSNFCSFKQENKGQMKANHQDVETLLTEKFLTQRTYFIVHLHSGLCNRTTACRKRVIIFENSDFIA